MISRRALKIYALAIAAVGNGQVLADDKGLDQSACQEQADSGWASFQRGDPASSQNVARAGKASAQAWPLRFDEHKWIPIPDSKITQAFAQEKEGKLQYILLVEHDSGAYISISWLGDTPIGQALAPEQRKGRNLPDDLSELVRHGIEKIGSGMNCLEMTDNAAALAFGEMGAVGIALTVSGSPAVFSLDKNTALAEETRPMNSDLEKRWEAAFLPQTSGSDILQVRWTFKKNSPLPAKDVPMALLVNPDRLSIAPPWSTQLAEAIKLRSAAKLREVANRTGWQLRFPSFANSPYSRQPQPTTP
jgi:hypothetical protein